MTLAIVWRISPDGRNPNPTAVAMRRGPSHPGSWRRAGDPR